MKSIKFKIGGLVLLCVLLVAATVGAISIQSSRRAMEENSDKLMESESMERTERINALLSRIEQSVTTLADYSLAELDDFRTFQTDSEYVNQYTQKLAKLALNAAGNTEGAMTAYVRYNPDFTKPDSGVFWSRNSIQEGFTELVPTDFSMYDPDDSAHVGWYYIPVKNKKPTWMSPYVNENLGVEMVSYVIPLFIDNVSVGIVGMDIDFNVIKDIVDEVKLYDSGYAYLADENGDIIYSPLNAGSGKGAWKGEEGALRNGMKLKLVAPVSEINADANKLIVMICLVALGGVVLALVVSSFIVKGIVKPLQDLNLAAEKISQGELNVQITSKSSDEVGTLADSFKKTVDRLRLYLDYIDETSKILYSMSQGDLTVEVKQEFTGEFVRIKEALLCILERLNSDLTSISLASGQVAEVADQVANGAQVVSGGAQEQSQAVEQLNLLTQELVEKARSNTQRAVQVQDLAAQAGASLMANGDQMAEMVEAMESISESNEEIIGMVHTIGDLAKQTNILALNASIEAARAGEAGKGFAIVAEEVKDLASKSTGAAQQITKLVEKASLSIQKGVSLAGETKDSIGESAKGANMVVGIVGKIVSDSKEQSEAAAQVMEDAEKISAVVQQTSAASQEEVASSEELSSQAQIMNSLVTKFRLHA